MNGLAEFQHRSSPDSLGLYSRPLLRRPLHAHLEIRCLALPALPSSITTFVRRVDDDPSTREASVQTIGATGCAGGGVRVGVGVLVAFGGMVRVGVVDVQGLC